MNDELEALREALKKIVAQDSRFMDNRRIDEWDIRCYVCHAYSGNELVNGHYQMVFEHKHDCPIIIAKQALAASNKETT